MVKSASFPRFVKVGEAPKVVCYKFEGAAPHAVALYLPGNFLTLRVALQRRIVRTCIVHVLD